MTSNWPGSSRARSWRCTPVPAMPSGSRTSPVSLPGSALSSDKPASGWRRRQLRPLAPAALPVLAPWPAARPALAVLQFFLCPANAPLSCRSLFGVFDPADELVASQRRYVIPRFPCRGVGLQRLAQVVGQLVHHPAEDALASHKPYGSEPWPAWRPADGPLTLRRTPRPPLTYPRPPGPSMRKSRPRAVGARLGLGLQAPRYGRRRLPRPGPRRPRRAPPRWGHPA